MVPDASLCCYGLEYFCNEGDETWTTRDPDLLELAKRELNRLGLLDPADVRDGCVVRQPKAYPVYDDRYKKNVETVVSDLRSRYRNLHLVGRNGMHRYNSMDHSMITGMLAARNIVAGSEVYDLWKVNRDEEYAETGVAGGELAFEQFTASKQDEPRVGAPEAD
jgi:protoporphyrinogen oxidase